MPLQLEAIQADVTLRPTTRYRLTSLSSILATESKDEDDDTIVEVPVKSELLGFRRFAKSLWSDFSARRPDMATTTLPNSDMVSPSNALALIEKMDNLTISNPSFRHHTLSKALGEHVSQGAGTFEPNVWNSFYDPKESQTYVAESIPRETFHDSISQNATKARRPLGEARVSLSNPSTHIHELSQRSDIGFQPTKRILQFTSLPSTIGLKSLLSQVQGGPLEKVVVHRADKSTKTFEHYPISQRAPLRNCVIDLWFFKPEHARDFMLYSERGLFIVNGLQFLPEWAPSHEDYGVDSSFYHPAPPQDIQDAVNKQEATRCLILKKCTTPKRSGNSNSSKHWSYPLESYCELDLDRMKMEFSAFGDILEISPVISKRLSIGIHYYDTESAIAAKLRFDDTSSDLRDIYSGWMLAYTKDITDKPCTNV